MVTGVESCVDIAYGGSELQGFLYRLYHGVLESSAKLRVQMESENGHVRLGVRSHRAVRQESLYMVLQLLRAVRIMETRTRTSITQSYFDLNGLLE